MSMKILKDHFFECITCFASLLSCGISYLALPQIKNEMPIFIVPVILLITNVIILIIAGIYLKLRHTYISKDKANQDIIKTLENEMKSLQKHQNQLDNDHKKSVIAINENTMKYVAKIASNFKRASKLYNEFCIRIIESSENSYAMIDSLNGIPNPEKLQSAFIINCNRFIDTLFDAYKRYTSNLLSDTISIIESYLHIAQKHRTVSVTVKLFENPFISDGNLSSYPRVYTAFRDKTTFDEKPEREIGGHFYSVNGNVDFVKCITKDAYHINNAKKSNSEYFNEHTDFDAYYNCTVVAPIKTKQSGNRYKFFGYLCCDCLNKDDNAEIFDDKTEQLLFSLAQLYAIFLDTLESNWNERFANEKSQESFLKKICEKTCKGNK